MECNKCGREMRIVGSVVAVENDNDPALPTRVYQVQQFKCLNPACANEPAQEKRHLLYSAEGK